MGWPLQTSTGPRLGIRLHGAADRRTLLLTGEMDLATAPALEGAVIRLCKEGMKQLVLDLSQLEFIDGSGLHAVSAARDTCRQCACELRIVPGRKELHRLFTISGLDGRLPFSPPGREAVGAHEPQWREDREGTGW
jgi:anti-sigma B factor antagonist